MDQRIIDNKIAFKVNSVVSVPFNHLGDDRTEPYYGVVVHLIHDDQARTKWKKDSTISIENIS